MRPLLFICALTLGTAPHAIGSVIYDFSYTATSGPIESFDFSITSPSYITLPNQTPSFTPFTVTDGSNSWTFTQSNTGFSPPTTASFCFGTPGVFMSAGCTSSMGPPNAFLLITFIGGFPTTPGVYPSNFGAQFYLPDDGLTGINLGTGTLILTISDTSVPEPSAMVLTGGGLSMLLLLGRQRRKRYSLSEEATS